MFAAKLGQAPSAVLVVPANVASVAQRIHPAGWPSTGGAGALCGHASTWIILHPTQRFDVLIYLYWYSMHHHKPQHPPIQTCK